MGATPSLSPGRPAMLTRHLLFLSFCFLAIVSAQTQAKSPFATFAKYAIEDIEHDVTTPVDAFYLIHTPPSFPDAWFLVELRRVKYEPWERSMGRVTRSLGDDGKERLTVKWKSGPLKGRVETAKIHRGTMQWLKPEKGLSPHGLEAFELNSTEMPAQAAELVRFMNYKSLQRALDQPFDE